MLGNLIVRNMRLRRDAPAIIFEGRTITHGEFAGRSFQLARALQRLGLGVGDRLAILAQNCPEYMEVYAAGELGGWTTVTINYRLAEPEVAYILSDSKPKVVVCEASLLDRLSEATRRALKHVITFGGEGPDVDYETALAAEEPEPPVAEFSPDTIAYLIYTSGTTGRPKGVMLSHRGQTLVGLCLGDRHGRATDRPRRRRHAALSHRRQEHLPDPVGARLHRGPASRVPARAVLQEPAGLRRHRDAAGADHAERPAGRLSGCAPGAAVAGEGLLLGGADAGRDAAARHEGARADLRPGLRHDGVRWARLPISTSISTSSTDRPRSCAGSIPPASR